VKKIKSTEEIVFRGMSKVVLQGIDVRSVGWTNISNLLSNYLATLKCCKSKVLRRRLELTETKPQKEIQVPYISSSYRRHLRN